MKEQVFLCCLGGPEDLDSGVSGEDADVTLD
jgi:hypothetical protein